MTTECPLGAYCLTNHRDSGTIKRFIKKYVDIDKSFDRCKEVLYVVPLDKHDEYHSLRLNQYDRQPSVNLTKVIEFGISLPYRGFSVSLNSKIDKISRSHIGFTFEGGLVLGLEIESYYNPEQARKQGEKLLDSLFNQFDCTAGLIAIEQGPPLSSRVFWTLEGIGIPVFTRYNS